jgi:hypothetical protein
MELELELELELIPDRLITEPHTFFSRDAILIQANSNFSFVNWIGLDRVVQIERYTQPSLILCKEFIHFADISA